MAEDAIVRPVPGPDAFARTDPAAIHSQAAVLLAMGMRLNGDPEELEARARATEGTAGLSVLPEEEWFPVPELRPTTRRFQSLREFLPDSLHPRARAEAAPEESSQAQAELARGVYDHPSAENAALLFEASLMHPDPLVRVSAAASYVDICADPEPLIEQLAAGAEHPDRQVSAVAATALARVEPDHPLLALRTGPETELAQGRSFSQEKRALTIVHGTWAANGRWWRPGGDFHSAVLERRPDTYNGREPFRWTGSYTRKARMAGAKGLARWVEAEELREIDLITHSHGGTVAMIANQAGLQLGRLVLLSCPVHARYMPNFSRITDKPVVSIRVHMDLVILADRGGQRFRDPQIQEVLLPYWFNHFIPHDPQVWNEQKLWKYLHSGSGSLAGVG